MRKYLTLAVTSFCVVALGALLASCGPTGNTGGQEEPVKKQQVAEAAPAQSMYDVQLKPLTTAECGRCHSYQFKWLQDKGGKHKFDCATCHETFHAYNPKLANWDEIMPKCQGCHDLPHGQDFAACLDCHQQPHAPKVIQFAKLEQEVSGKEGVVVCANCHSTVGSEFAANPSKHNTAVNCQGCHAEVHGTIPSCMDCHEPHVPDQVYADCLVCHSPHSAMNIKQYPESMSNAVCGSCHEGVYNNLLANVTKHTSLQCATCHASHGVIPKCQDCHNEPHGEGLHKRFTSCLDCHADPHNLPVNKNK